MGRLDEDYIPSQLKDRPWLHKDWRPEEKENESVEDDEQVSARIYCRSYARMAYLVFIWDAMKRTIERSSSTNVWTLNHGRAAKQVGGKGF